jgi:transposase
MNRSYIIDLTSEEKDVLKNFTKKGNAKVNIIKRAQILLFMNENKESKLTQKEIAQALQTTTTTIYNVSKLYSEKGLDAVLTYKKRSTPPIPPKITGEKEAHVIAIACSEAPDGREKWTYQLIANRLIELQIFDYICAESVRKALKKRNIAL